MVFFVDDDVIVDCDVKWFCCFDDGFGYIDIGMGRGWVV